MLLGDGAVGKTSLLKMYHAKEFDESHMVTMGIDFVKMQYTPQGTTDDLAIKIWDTAG